MHSENRQKFEKIASGGCKTGGIVRNSKKVTHERAFQERDGQNGNRLLIELVANSLFS